MDERPTSARRRGGDLQAVTETKPCTASTRAGRMAKARQFLVAAETIATVMDDQEIADAFVTLCVHAGVAAADVICCARLGVYHSGENHNEAVRAPRLG